MTNVRVLALLVAAGCGSGTAVAPVATVHPVAPAPPSPSQPTVPTDADPAPPTLRLPTVAHPLRNRVDLTLDPSREDFSGTITTELEITTATRVLWLDATEITIDHAVLTVGGEQLVARPIVVPKDFVGLALPRELAPGRATLTIAYRGKIHPNDGDGIYTAKERGDWYAFTQFENTDARQAFPCFDEPSYKVPWQLTLHTRQALVALSNTPVTAETAEPNGMKAVAFAETPALPSYLVAFAVGPFELVDAGKTASGIPIRIVVPHGRTADAAYAAQTTKPLLEQLEAYFGTPYPFPKLDIVAVSVFNAGAMENPGLITFRQSLVLIPPAEQTIGDEQSYAVVAAHEMSHMWFGDYVTMAWWDDTWLNESFASWMESKIVQQWKPAWKLEVGEVARVSGVMGQDSLDAARAIRQPIKTSDDIANAFDGITYGKGEAVLDMIEHSVGAAAFQKGVRAYLAAHARGNATYDDFVGAMSTAVGSDLHPVFDSFVLQSGVPMVSFELVCAAGAAPKVRLAQHRYKPIGSQIDPNRTWHVPVCMKWRAGAATGTDCTTLADASAEVALTAKTCPDWLLPNAGGVGYYRSLLRGDLLARLLKPRVTLALTDRVALIGDVSAAVSSGDAELGTALQLVDRLAKDPARQIVGASIQIVDGINDDVPDDLRAKYEKLILRLYGARAHALGWHDKPRESDDIKQLRPGLLSLVAGWGKDPALIKEATALAWKWLDDKPAAPAADKPATKSAIDADLVDTVLSVAARYGNQKLFDRFHADAKTTQDRVERTRLLGAMAAFTDPAIVKQALAIVLTDEFETRESFDLLQGGLQDPRTRAMALQFVEDHFDAIAAKLPAPYRAYLAFTFITVCDDAKKPAIESAYRAKFDAFIGGPRIFAQALEALSLCSASRKAQTPGVIAFLRKQP